jgi:lipopolysaccharide/colanic/teichoic acid biosynthesis glycosyltransferase
METEARNPVIEANGQPPPYWYPILKRVYDIFFAVVGLVLLAPLGLLIAILTKLSDGGPVFYRQRRIGRLGQPFHILKFRTMVVEAEKQGPAVTKDQDPRITRVGRWLRKAKLDELPQLWNVLSGSMSFVGPRPEVPRYVDRYTPEQRQLLNFTPGITDLATLVFRNEETLLRNADNVEEFYVQHCIPRKFRLNLRYAKNANLIEDTLIIIETLCPYWFGIACGYVLALAISLWIAYSLRFEFQIPESERMNLHRFWFIIIPLQMAFLVWRKQFGGLLSYFDVPEMKQLAYGLSLAGAVQLFVWYISDGDFMPARSIIVINAVMAFVMLVGIRTLLRNLRLIYSSRIKQHGDTRATLRVGIVGAGELGAWLARQLNARNNPIRRVDVFFDDDADKWNQRLCDIPVVGMPECILDGSWTGRLDEVILAIPSASPDRVQEILSILARARIPARTLPSLEEILAK